MVTSLESILGENEMPAAALLARAYRKLDSRVNLTFTQLFKYAAWQENNG